MKRAYVTLLSTNDYFLGVLALYQNLKDINSKYPLVVCVTEDINQENIDKLKQLDLELIQIPKLTYSMKYIQSLSLDKRYLQNIASKFYCFGLEQFDKIVCLDCDQIFLSNIDELFEYPHGSAISTCGYIRGGLVILEPSVRLRDELINISLSRGVNEERALNIYFPNFKLETEKQVPRTYGEPSFAELMSGKTPKGIHFIGGNKPFKSNACPNMLLIKYWFQYKQNIDKALSSLKQ